MGTTTEQTWEVYGRTRGQYPRALHRTFTVDELAWAYAIECRLKYGDVDMVLVLVERIGTRTGDRPRRWKTRNTVLQRWGHGRGWWE